MMYHEFVLPGDLVFDVGAYVGHKTDIFLALGAQVIVVEPHPQLAAHLDQKYRENPNVRVVAQGLSDHTGHLPFYPCLNSPTLSTFSPRWKVSRPPEFTYGDPILVPVTTLDDLADRFGLPHFIKIDVEGYEAFVLRGLTQPVTALCFEWSDGFLDQAGDGLFHLESLDPAVRCNYTRQEEPGWALSEWVNADDLVHRLWQERCGWGDIYAWREQIMTL